ncbi:YbjN domain-containing protein [Pseudonocardia sp. HH130630-07]|uniref:YbjN domain-containing protein n=1 Tax=Pseudonocardia sp. HH130630-07 TaxID=1690815 RepID=UPI0009F2D417|nr:YbjN domain-containing protein [Pseudonocardia sp. HH130630-07]
MDVEHVHRGPGQWLVTLPGQARLQTQTWLLAREQTLAVQAFVCRHPDENHDGVHRFMLLRNARLYGVHYCLDRVGDIHLVGRIPRHAVTAEELDRVLGAVLEAADGDFNTFLELGFASSIRREHAWRTRNGESTANLAAFEHLLDG